MADVALDTRFIGIAADVNLTERKSAVINQQTAPYTLQDISDSTSVGSPIFQPNIIKYAGTTCGAVSIDLYGGGYSYNVFGSSEIQAPNLVTMYGGITLVGDYANGSYANFHSFLQLIEMPLLESVGQLLTIDPSTSSIDIESWIALTEINLGSLTYAQGGAITIVNNPVLSILNISSLNNVPNGYDINIIFNPSLESLDISNLLNFTGNFTAFANGFNQTSIDGILNQLANEVELYNKQVTLNQGTNAIPSAAGLLNVDILVANGCTVLVNT